MGFLDRMVSDLIRDNTGINARRLVRRIGGGKLLALGGAALAASLLAEKKGAFGSRAAQPGAPQPGAPPAGPPPVPGAGPPPVPGAAPPPVPGAAAPPPEPEAEEADVELPQELTYAVVRAMVAAALADGHLSAEEKEIIHKRLGESGLAEDQIRQVHQDLVLPPSPEELAAMAPAAEALEILYRFAALVVLADQDASELERRWLERLAAAFELDGERKAALEAELFG